SRAVSRSTRIVSWKNGDRSSRSPRSPPRSNAPRPRSRVAVACSTWTARSLPRRIVAAADATTIRARVLESRRRRPMASDLATVPRQPERIPLAVLLNHPRNYQSHPDDQLAHLVKSLQNYGQYRPVLICSDNTI